MRPPSSIAMKKTSSSRRRKLGFASLILGAILAVAALAVFVSLTEREVGDVAAIEDALRSSAPTVVQSKPEAPVTESSPEPEASPRAAPLWQPNDQSLLSDVGSEVGPAPVGLLIESLSIDAPVVAKGVNERTGEMAVPRNVNEIGWYRYGPTPGDPGSAVLAAHVDLESQGPGVFFDLKKLEPGDLIRVIYDDGSERTFEVEARATYLKEELPLDVIFSRDGPPVLTLITCGGGFTSDIARYDSNVVVYARPVYDISPALEVT